MAELRGKGSAGGGMGRRGAAGPGDPRARLKHLMDAIRAGSPRAAYLCSGDEFLAEQAAQELIAALLSEAERATNLERFSGDALDPGALLASLRTRPLFGGRKVAAVFGAGFLASRESAGQLVETARRMWDAGDHDRGARLFLRALAAAGVDQEEFADPGWSERLASDPDKTLPGVEEDLRKWVPTVRDHCLNEGLAVPKSSNVGDLLEEELQKGFPPGNVLILVAPAVDQRRRLFKALETGGGVLQFSVDRKKETEVPRDILRRELAARAGAAGKRIHPEAAEAILGRAGASLRGFAEELDKLFTYVGDRPVVEPGDVEAAFGDRTEAHVFDLTDALVERDVEKALKAVHSLQGQGEEPIYLLNLLAGAVRGLIQAREILDGPLADRWQPGLEYGAFRARVWEPARAAAIEGDRGFFAMHPFRAYSLLRGASRFAMDDLVRAIELLFETDLRIKTTGLDPVRLLELLLFDLCRPTEQAPA